jgi:hypothetical protein
LIEGTSITNTAFFTMGGEGGWTNVVTTTIQQVTEVYLPLVVRDH